MKRTAVNLVLDVFALLSMLGMVLTGIIVRYALPPGTGGRGGGHGWTLWGMGRHEWGDLHFYLAIAVVVTLVLHVVLHWKWVCSAFRRMLMGTQSGAGSRGWRRGIALFTVSLIVGGSGTFLYVAVGQVEHTLVQTALHDAPSIATTEGQPESANGRFRGSITLREAADLTGISMEEARRRCALPETVDPDQRMGRIARDRGLTMSALRARLTGESALAD